MQRRVEQHLLWTEPENTRSWAARVWKKSASQRIYLLNLISLLIPIINAAVL